MVMLSQAANENSAPTSDDPQDWLRRHFEIQGISYDYKTDGLRKDGNLVDPRVAFASLRLAAKNHPDRRIKSYLTDCEFRA